MNNLYKFFLILLLILDFKFYPLTKNELILSSYKFFISPKNLLFFSKERIQKNIKEIQYSAKLNNFNEKLILEKIRDKILYDINKYNSQKFDLNISKKIFINLFSNSIFITALYNFYKILHKPVRNKINDLYMKYPSIEIKYGNPLIGNNINYVSGAGDDTKILVELLNKQMSYYHIEAIIGSFSLASLEYLFSNLNEFLYLKYLKKCDKLQLIKTLIDNELSKYFDKIFI